MFWGFFKRILEWRNDFRKSGKLSKSYRRNIGYRPCKFNIFKYLTWKFAYTLFVSELMYNSGSKLKKLWIICSFAILWSIWLERNKRIYNDRLLPIEIKSVKIFFSWHGTHSSGMEPILQAWNLFFRHEPLDRDWDSVVKRTIFFKIFGPVQILNWECRSQSGQNLFSVPVSILF